jgi:hypothetical protein
VLEAAEVQIVEDAHDADGSDLWVVDSSASTRQNRGKLKSRDRRSGPQRLIISPSADLQRIRELVADALTSASIDE